jgi:hypothetical protein
LNEQINAWTDQHHDLMLKKKNVEMKLSEAIRMGKESMAHVTNVEVRT